MIAEFFSLIAEANDLSLHCVAMILALCQSLAGFRVTAEEEGVEQFRQAVGTIRHLHNGGMAVSMYKLDSGPM
jgi:hypothetical protein